MIQMIRDLDLNYLSSLMCTDQEELLPINWIEDQDRYLVTADVPLGILDGRSGREDMHGTHKHPRIKPPDLGEIL